MNIQSFSDIVMVYTRDVLAAQRDAKANNVSNADQVVLALRHIVLALFVIAIVLWNRR